MAKKCADKVLEGLLEVVNDSTRMNANAGEPTDKTDADTTSMLANTNPTFGTFADGDTSGRKMEVEAKSGVSVTNSGVADHVSLTDATDLVYVTTVSNTPTLNANGTVNFGAWDIEVYDPA